MIIKCSYTDLKKVDELKPNPQNPNTHTDGQIRLLAKVLETQGWRSPIVVSKRSGFIVKGHGRLSASKKAGFTEVPVDFQDYENEEEELADLIADNRLSELSAFDNQGLKDLLEKLDTGAIDLELTGFELDEIELLMSQFYQPDEPIDISDADFKETCTIKIVCENIQEMEKIQTILGITAKETSGKVLINKLQNSVEG